jgi:hypothetical protein
MRIDQRPYVQHLNAKYNYIWQQVLQQFSAVLDHPVDDIDRHVSALKEHWHSHGTEHCEADERGRCVQDGLFTALKGTELVDLELLPVVPAWDELISFSRKLVRAKQDIMTSCACGEYTLNSGWNDKSSYGTKLGEPRGKWRPSGNHYYNECTPGDPLAAALDAIGDNIEMIQTYIARVAIDKFGFNNTNHDVIPEQLGAIITQLCEIEYQVQEYSYKRWEELMELRRKEREVL